MASCAAQDGDPKGHQVKVGPLKKPWRVYCGTSKQFEYPDPDGKWERLYRAQEFWHQQMKIVANNAADRRKRAIVQVRREKMLQTRRDAHDMFAAHANACHPPPPPKLGSFEDLIPKAPSRGKKTPTRPMSPLTSRDSERALSVRPQSRATNASVADVFLTRLTSNALSQQGEGVGHQAGGDDASSSAFSNDHLPPWPSAPVDQAAAREAAQNTFTKVKSLPSSKLRSAADLWYNEEAAVGEGDEMENEELESTNGDGFVCSVKSNVPPSMPIKQSTFLEAPLHLKSRPTSIRAHLRKASQMTEKRPTAQTDRPLTSSRSIQHIPGKSFTMEKVAAPPVFVSSVTPEIIVAPPRKARSYLRNHPVGGAVAKGRPQSARAPPSRISETPTSNTGRAMSRISGNTRSSVGGSVSPRR